MSISLEGRVAIVTGAGRGLGRAHALALAERGARVVVNELSDNDVVDEIRAQGGDAIASGADVADENQVNEMIARTIERWGRVDILVNNAGILRDKTFQKMSLDDFRLVIDVHLMGSVYCTKAVWDIMREQQFGRIVYTTSSSGLYGNFGQSNYSAAKMALVGLMNTLHLEGAKYGIHVNCLAPAAGTRMTDGLMPDEVFELLSPDAVSPAVVFLASEDAPSRAIICAGGGSFAVHKVFETVGVSLRPDKLSAEGIADAWDAISDEAGMQTFQGGFEQTGKFALMAASAVGIDITGQDRNNA